MRNSNTRNGLNRLSAPPPPPPPPLSLSLTQKTRPPLECRGRWGGGGFSLRVEKLESEGAAERRIEESVQSAARLVGQMLPGLETAPVFKQSCLYTSTPDHDYVLGELRKLPGVVIAGGGSGHGFKMGPAIGDAAAALALGDEVAMPVDMFRVDRFGDDPWGIVAGSK